MALSAESSLPPPSPPTPNLRSLEPSWGGRDVLSGVVWFVAIFLFGQVVVVIAALATRSSSDAPTYTAAFIVGAAVEVAIGVVAYQFSIGKYGGGLRVLGVRPISGRTLLWAAAAFGGALAVSVVYGVIVEVLHIDQLKSQCAEQIPSSVRHTRWLLALASVVVIAFAPVFEELFFRGFVFPGLAKAWGIAAAIVVSGLLFAAAHLDYKSFVPIAGVGMVFAFSYWRSGNIFSTMTAHAAFNSTSIAVIAAGSCDAIAGPHVSLMMGDWALTLIRFHGL